MIIQELYRYPLKGGQGDAQSSSTVFSTGFSDDRRWLLVDKNGHFLTQRKHAKIALIQCRPAERLHFQFADQSISLDRASPSSVSRTIRVWSDTVEGWDLGDQAAAFFSAILQEEVRLCESKPQHERRVDAKYTENQEVKYLFADSFPYLVISQESLDLLNEKLGGDGAKAVGIDRFRPNIVIRGWQAHAEDQVQTLNIGGRVHLRLSKPCSRCPVTCVDQTTGVRAEEPLRTLAQYRKLGMSRVYFGMYAWVLSGAGETIQCGDSVRVEH